MSKSRFSSSDVRAMVRDMRESVLGLRLANVYDLSDNKTYVFKFNSGGASDGSADTQQKSFLICESGVRFHCTKYVHDKRDLPSPFSMKLRRFIRLKRLEDIQQIKFDRVVDLKFGTGDIAYHVILELYSQGNIVLTDANYEIISLLHSHEFEKDVAIKVGEIYPMSYTTSMACGVDDSSNAAATTTDGGDEVDAFVSACVTIDKDMIDGSASAKNAKKVTLKSVLLSKTSMFAAFGPEIIEHCLHRAGVASSSKVQALVANRAQAAEVLEQLKTAADVLTQLEQPQPGFVIYKEGASSAEGTPTQELLEYVPLLFAQHKDKLHLTFASFAKAVDYYYCNIEDQKLAKQAKTAEETAQKRVFKVKTEQNNLIEALSRAQVDLEEQATLVEVFADEVDKACLVINSAASAGMSWDDIAEMVQTETKRGNPIASLVHQLKLDTNAVVLRLQDPFLEEEQAEGARFKLVEIDLSLSAFANARHLYGNRKTAKAKEQKTVEASLKVIQNVEAAALKSFESQKIKKNLNAIRHVYWFERFNWCISTEGYLILSGRDAQQNELLVKRYLRAGDAYIHADLPGAASCIVRCKGDATDGAVMRVSPVALEEAGALSVCRSGAWDAKAFVAAYWVHASQVTKSAPSGEYLGTGSFMVYGKKNYLPPTALEMGFGVLFRLDDSCVASHLGERKDKVRDGFSENESVSTQRLTSKYDTDDVVEAVDSVEIAGDGIVEGDGEEPEVADEEEDATELAHRDGGDDGGSPDGSDHEEQPFEAVAASVEKAKATKTSGRPAKGEVEQSVSGAPKKKTIPKKKARRYAEQDEEDRELAMLTLGHLKYGEQKKEQDTKDTEVKRKEETLRKQEKVGIKSAKKGWSSLVSVFGADASEALKELIDTGKVNAGDIDESEIKALARLSDSDAATVLRLFRDGNFSHEVGNKSAFLAGIIRRFAKESKNAVVSAPKAIESVAKNAAEELEIQAIVDDEGIADEEAGANADELEKLTGCPRGDDIVLFGVPMCGPYSVFQNFKFKVKLTPGVQKKGKAAKQAIEVFLKNKDISNSEKSAIKALADPEMVAILIGNVKLSTPGLQQVQKAQRGQKKASSKSK